MTSQQRGLTFGFQNGNANTNFDPRRKRHPELVPYIPSDRKPFTGTSKPMPQPTLKSATSYRKLPDTTKPLSKTTTIKPTSHKSTTPKPSRPKPLLTKPSPTKPTLTKHSSPTKPIIAEHVTSITNKPEEEPQLTRTDDESIVLEESRIEPDHSMKVEQALSKLTITEATIPKPAFAEPTKEEPIITEPTIIEPLLTKPKITEPIMADPSTIDDEDTSSLDLEDLRLLEEARRTNEERSQRLKIFENIMRRVSQQSKQSSVE